MEVDDQMWQPLIAGSNWKKKECILSAVHNSRFKALWVVKIRQQMQQSHMSKPSVTVGRNNFLLSFWLQMTEILQNTQF